MLSISLVFPAYNEEENIAFAVQKAKKVLSSVADNWEIIVVNDGSRDGTCQIINQLSHLDSRIKPIHHHANLGYGAALKSGITSAKYDLIFFCDSDLQFDIGELPVFIELIRDCDIVIGYRVKRQDPLYRKLNAWCWNLLIIGAMVNTDILVQAHRCGFHIKEQPVTHYPRHRGKQTGANIRVIIKAFNELFKLYRKLNNTGHPYQLIKEIKKEDRL